MYELQVTDEMAAAGIAAVNAHLNREGDYEGAIRVGIEAALQAGGFTDGADPSSRCLGDQLVDSGLRRTLREIGEWASCYSVADQFGPAHLEVVTTAENKARGMSPPARNARKTYCPAGHAYDEANTDVRPDGRRKCRLCNRERKRNDARLKRERLDRVGRVCRDA